MAGSDTDPTVALERLTTEVAELRQLLGARIQAEDATREKAFDHLYDELRQYKEDFLFQAEKPLLLDLLLFYDSLQWFQESLVKEEMSPDVIADSFQYLVDEFLELLYRRDVTAVESSEKFDRKVHKAVKVVETDAVALDYRIAQVLKRGFQRAGKALRAEEVVIHRLRRKRDA